MENLDHPPTPPLPKIKDEKMQERMVRFWPSRGFILDLGGGGGGNGGLLFLLISTKYHFFRFDKREKETGDRALKGSRKRTRQPERLETASFLS